MSRISIFVTIGVLLALEFLTVLVFKLSRSHYLTIADRLLAGRDPNSLELDEQEQFQQQLYFEHHKTIYRKLDLVCIAFQLPGLASWGILTRKPDTPPWYCFPVSFGFWLIFALIVEQLIS
jgi:hypothetical protein